MLFPYSTSNCNPHGSLTLNTFDLVSPQDFSHISNKPMEFLNPNFNLLNSFTQMNYLEQQHKQLLDQQLIQNHQLFQHLSAPSLENTNNYFPIQNFTPNQNFMFASQQQKNAIFPSTSCQNIFNQTNVTIPQTTLSQAITPIININQQFVSFPLDKQSEIPKNQIDSQKTIQSPMNFNGDILRQKRVSLNKKSDLDSSSTFEKNERIELRENNFRNHLKSQTSMCFFKNAKYPQNESVSVICTTGSIGNQNTEKSDNVINYSSKRLSQNSTPESIQLEVTSQPLLHQKQEQKTQIDEDKISGSQSAGKSFFLISNYKKKLINSLDREEQQILIQMRRCKKFNFSKNVIKQFFKVVQTQINYLYHYQSDSSPKGSESSNSILKNSNPLASDQNELRSNLKAYLSSNSYTHASIKRLMLHPLFSLYFSDFLEFHTADWIKQGKTKYKQEQTIMISFLKLCLKNPKLLIFLSEHDPTKPSKFQKQSGSS